MERHELKTNVAIVQDEDYHTATKIMYDEKLMKVQSKESLQEAYKMLRSASDPMKVYVLIVSDEVTMKQYLELRPDLVVSEPNALYIIFYVGQQKKLGHHISNCAAGNLMKLWKQYYVLNIVTQYPCSDQWGDYFYIYRPFKKIGNDSWGAVVMHKMEDVLLDHRRIVNSLKQMNEYPLRMPRKSISTKRDRKKKTWSTDLMTRAAEAVRTKSFYEGS
ncbi:unnamed protein product [Acanthoscelides obtectus]|uniref:Uncharacterized protein n=1 Tax=Acanthoscelides obtectus TaxID=200917 RepID=A0A9P0LEV9_ACAOB|nr:unnamed protein product [Acanthoscelides obtectus]CAK1650087.1 hypothetical protein AOBTE_LOCUS16592 [Acanthoscelides obtectus]